MAVRQRKREASLSQGADVGSMKLGVCCLPSLRCLSPRQRKFLSCGLLSEVCVPVEQRETRTVGRGSPCSCILLIGHQLDEGPVTPAVQDYLPTSRFSEEEALLLPLVWLRHRESWNRARRPSSFQKPVSFIHCQLSSTHRKND